MDALRLILAGGVALVALGALAQLVWGWLDIPSLADVPAPPAWTRRPRVSVIVAARDEERHILAAVTALLGQDYPDYQVVVVDDRSSDRTSEIIARVSRQDARVRALRVNELPDGWLGKNHALHLGAESADGELLLFADADVVLEPSALSRAVRLFGVERADHLAVAPALDLPTWPLALVVNYFMMWFLLWLRPWRARNPRSSAFIGIGAFNLVRASVYRGVGGHERIRLRPDDDIMLGKLLKGAGAAQRVADGTGVVRVEWYATLGQLARGFRKNAFAGLGYSVWMVAGAVLGNLVLAVWPFIAVWITGGAERALYATAAIAQVVAYGGAASSQGARRWLAPLYPLASVLFVAILCAAVSRTLRRNGIEWRGTHYRLEELRGNRV
ncbi:MAG TPA: glycosyltransferase family 2 protein [Gemmatimonadaceae bacterium]|nr:glycosyltransferase family 2 protein [Gemmatimonadaceae bacterium]